jgi:hypothetical protein
VYSIFFAEDDMAANRSFDRQSVLSVAGIMFLAVIVTLALIPRKVRAHMADAFTGIGAGRMSFLAGSPSQASHNHPAASAIHKNSRDERVAERFLDASQSWPADGWSPAAALARAAFPGFDSLDRNPFLPGAGLPDNSREGSDSTSGGWSGQGRSDGASNGNTSGGQGAAGGVSVGGQGTAIFSGSRSEATKPADLTSLHDSESRGGLSFTGTNAVAERSAVLDWQGGSEKPLSITKALVTDGNNPFGDNFMDQVVDAPYLPAGSGSKSKTPGSGNGGMSGNRGADVPALAADGVTSNGDGTVGQKPGHKIHALNSTPAGDLSDDSNVPGSDEIIGEVQAVPEPTASKLFLTALLGIIALKLGSTRKA